MQPVWIDLFLQLVKSSVDDLVLCSWVRQVGACYLLGGLFIRNSGCFWLFVVRGGLAENGFVSVHLAASKQLKHWPHRTFPWPCLYFIAYRNALNI